ncbi:transcriptional repressor [Candidatus Saccharibacteria bacterium]|nr:transcriptional repressor [Candidatus Saccharibacteria bacterium]MDQ5958823.1 Fur family transcriptional regulator, ferric uptake regulator [Patescibacteria group bacterium]
MEHLKNILSRNGFKVTNPRKEVFKILNNSSKPLTINEILVLVTISERTSVYRTLELFSKLKIVEIINVGWKRSYELAEPFSEHHHHLICNICNKIVKIDQPKLEQLIRIIANEYDFKDVKHHVELTGVCKNCAKKHTVY